MKKVISIPLMILILFSGITINLASHYCMDSLVSNKLSFSGKLATCGMEDHGNRKDGINPEDTCSNISHSYTFSTNYVPSFEKNFVNIIPVVNFILNITTSLPANNISGTNISFIQPPGRFSPNIVDREIICIYRI
jgi:hypothetical protein